MKKLILLATVLILAGCASQRVWTKPGATAQDFERDKWDCQAQASQMAGSMGDPGNPFNALMVKDLTMDCLRMRGWQANR
jgi:uncharacterized protein YceK